MNESFLSEIRGQLRNMFDEKTVGNAASFFKEEVRFYGVKTGLVIRLARERFAEIKHLGRTEIYALCEDLLSTNYLEEAFIALEWSERLLKQYQPEDFAVFEGWLDKYVSNWATCDTLCNHTIGSFIEKYPEYIGRLKEWARSENRWKRRAAAVTLIVPAKQGKFLDDAFEIALILMADTDDLVQKGYGWLLKEESRTCPQEVFDFLMKYRPVMPRTAFRYALEKMPPYFRRIAMQKLSGNH